mgnify:CR=1 FL=1
MRASAIILIVDSKCNQEVGMSEEIRIVNHEEPGRPLKVRRLADGRVEVRIGDMGITDAVVTLTAEEFDQLKNL